MNYFIAAGIILGAGLLVSALIFLFGKNKQRGIQEYKHIRDKLTKREPEPQEDFSQEVRGGLNLGNIIGGFIVILVGATLLPEINKVVSESNTNVTGAASSLMGLTTLFFALAIGMVAIGIAVSSLRTGGLV